MRANSETYHQVAKHCSEFSPAKGQDAAYNSTNASNEVSCTKCRHFDSKEYCKLDLYDRILDQHNF